MNRRTLLAALASTATLATAATALSRGRGVVVAQLADGSSAPAPAPAPAPPAGATIAAVEPWEAKLIAAAESQIGVTVSYDPAYVRIAYPGGDVPRDRGVCTDVVVRAYRDGLGIDLQQLVHADMAANFAAYPTKWRLARPDSHIDHRRVPNLQTFLRRRGAALPVGQRGEDYAPGDLVTMMVSGTLPHIAIVSSRRSADGARPLIIHNIGAGTRQEDRLFEFPLTGHYRLKP